jgi:hypothetical protein
LDRGRYLSPVAEKLPIESKETGSIGGIEPFIDRDKILYRERDENNHACNLDLYSVSW